MQNFGKKQINDKSLSVVEFYPDAGELFGEAASLSDGITIVTKNHKKASCQPARSERFCLFRRSFRQAL